MEHVLQSTTTPRKQDSTHWLALGAVAGPVLFTLASLALGSLRPGYSTISQQVSALAIGTQAAFATPVITFPVVGLLLRRARSWRRFGTLMLLGGPLTLALLIGLITSIPMSEMATGGGSFGLWQRARGIEVFAWFVALGWLAFRRSR